jgi:hypothetical protein
MNTVNSMLEGNNVLARDQQFNSGNYESAVSASIRLNAGDYIYFHSNNFENRTGGVTFTATKGPKWKHGSYYKTSLL